MARRALLRQFLDGYFAAAQGERSQILSGGQEHRDDRGAGRLQDAPKLFGASVERQYLKRYIEAREGWVPEMDQRDDSITKLMSTPDEQARYAAGRNAPLSPAKALGKDGHVSIENFGFHLLELAKDGETRRYLVQFDRTVWRGGNKDPMQSWSGTVDFQWHLELPMRPDDRSDNPGGFQVLGYSASSDSPDQRGSNAHRRNNPARLGLACRSRPGCDRDTTQSAAQIRVVPYSPLLSTEIVGVIGQSTTITFPPGEASTVSCKPANPIRTER